MRVSAKGKYALAAMVYLAQSGHDTVKTVARISEELNISKIYLEQVFSLLKRAGLVLSTKGAQGGYRLALLPEKITAYAVLKACDQALFEKAEPVLSEDHQALNHTLDTVYQKMDEEVKTSLESFTLSDLAEKVAGELNSYMFFI
ncbi:MAG: Rrf2 family transcriptional regulator [Clostridiales bacterium]|jgi:Rrf2 family protein|nr:Rrf2 family transcriptional regulator [Clostridiales bacterium]MCI1962181.1 Rrf2 family transcriptional regulator [Clostridiales bacterium]MCI2022623.1 Rrf2 family transcriptional regulator [Clostridiales bacterium]MCI2027062.1 Rrf2 family transcriptional regulator [Clostridiales bacterium]CAB1244089.1 Rrf2 family transcriptional regulator [Ruminococcaceae bacterium BL-4]